LLDKLLEAVRNLIPMPKLDYGVPVLDEAELDDRIVDADTLVVAFYADWCGFCRAFAPTFRENADELPGEVVAANISSESDPRWSRFGVDAVPTLVAFRQGEPVARRDARPGRGLDESDLDAIADRLAA
jgi:thiol-disulfide isomerase/thioredoxin